MDIIFLCIIGAILSLDTVAVFQVLVSQPIVSCTLIGWLANDPMTGIHIGILMQLIWISTLPVGAVTIPDGNLGAIVAAIISVKTKDIIPEFNSIVILFSILIGMGMSFMGSHVLNTIRTGNVYILNKLLDKIDASKLNRIGMAITWSIVVNFCIFFAIITVSSLIGISIINVILSLDLTDWIHYTRYAEVVILGAGAGLTFTLVKGHKPKWIMAVFMLIALVIIHVY